MPNLTIVILTYNSAHIVASCLKSINFSKYKVLVVDNASSDGTVAVVKKNFPQAEVIICNKNKGYGRGNNVGLNQVNTEFALVLNPDATISENDIELVLQEMRKYGNVALAGPLVLDSGEKAADKLVLLLDEKNRFLRKENANYFTKFLVGAVLFLKMPLMKKIGFFEEEIFLYYEDNAICDKSIAAGYENILVSNAVANHNGGTSTISTPRISYKKNWHLIWSKLYWKKKRHGIFRAKRSALKYLAIYLLKTLFYGVTFNLEKLRHNLGSFCGAFSFFIGLRAFNEKDDSRG